MQSSPWLLLLLLLLIRVMDLLVLLLRLPMGLVEPRLPVALLVRLRELLLRRMSHWPLRACD